MTDFDYVNQLISNALLKYKIDNLALEMELVEIIKTAIRKATPIRTQEEIKTDLSDAVISSGMAWMAKDIILHEIQDKLHMNPSGKDGESFIDFAYLRLGHGEQIGRFITWWNENGGAPKYWTFKRMRELWPMAFVTKGSEIGGYKTIGGYTTMKSEPSKDKWEQGTFVPEPKEDK
jgi:hypothetical protein